MRVESEVKLTLKPLLLKTCFFFVVTLQFVRVISHDLEQLELYLF